MGLQRVSSFFPLGIWIRILMIGLIGEFSFEGLTINNVNTRESASRSTAECRGEGDDTGVEIVDPEEEDGARGPVGGCHLKISVEHEPLTTSPTPP